MLPPPARPPTIVELEEKIDVAIAIARSSEAAAMTVADAAMESAEQARRAAELAVKASEAAERADALAAPASAGRLGAAHAARTRPSQDEAFTRFSSRADRLGARLERLQRR